MKAAQVLVKICSTNQLLHQSSRSLSITFEYCQWVNTLCTNLKWKDLLDVESASESENGRMVDKDEMQNHKAIVNYLVCGIAGNNESLIGYLMNILVKFYHRNRTVTRDANLPVIALVEQEMVYLIGSWLDKGLPISR